MEFIVMTGGFGVVVGLLLSGAAKGVASLIGLSFGVEQALPIVAICACVAPIASFAIIVLEEARNAPKRK